MEDRRERRLFVQCPVSIEGKQGISEGTLINLSVGGGAIESGIPVQFGTVLTLRVHLPSLHEPIFVDQAEVTWRAGDDFGVKFLQLGPQERTRLNQVIEDLRQGILQSQAPPVRTC